MRVSTVSFAFVTALAAAACGNHSPASPGAPSPTAVSASPSPASLTGATISGNVAGLSSQSALRALKTSMTVSVTGSPASSAVDDSGHFLLQNVPAGHVELHFTGPGVDARLPLDDVAEHSTITITVRVAGTTAELDENEREDPDHNAEVEGLVTAVGSGSLTVAGKTVTVTSSTVIVHGDTPLKLSDIKVGDRVHVHGTMSGASIVATKIEDQNGAATPGRGDEHGGEVEVSGTVSGRSSGCPVTFTLSSTTVATNSGTVFKDTSCAALKNGDRVEVKGTKQTNGSVLASRVEKED